MNVPTVQINQTFGRIAIDYEHGHTDIHHAPAQVEMNIEQPAVHIEQKPDQLEIDQTQAQAAYGYMTPMEMNDRIHAQIPEVVQQIIAKIAQDGKRMADVHISDNVIAELAQEPRRDMIEFEYVAPPAHDPVHIQYTPGEVVTDVTEGSVNIEMEPQPVILDHIPSHVHIGMEQYPSIAFEVVGEKVDRMV